MNRAYRLIWNESLDIWVVAPEIASARGKRSRVKRSAAILLLPLAVGSHATLAADLAASALPGGGQVTAGQASISSSGASMAIDQGSQRAIINWQNFDIGSQASVTFRQPDASAVALNRVSGPTASRIEGQLTANGQVFLINPGGVLFGQGARVNVGGLVASTLNIRDQDFLAGNYAFTGTGGAIENYGTINAAPGGYLAFIAPRITNAGTLNAPQGTVAMGAGERVTLNFAGNRLVGLSVAADTLDTLIENRQAIRAEGGAILLTAAGAEAVTRGVINNSGVLEASSLTSDGGRIVLTAGSDITLGAGSSLAVDGKKGGEITVQAQSGTLLADGSLSARGAEGKGGNVQLLGHQVGLVNAALVDASGTTGGGTVLVGGDYQGGNAGVQNAFRTYVGPQATIKADALQQGDGGKVVVWADDATRYYGSISARGGSQSGNGGFVETSGRAYLEANGSVDASAPAGAAGQWLLDPRNVTINAAGPTSGGTLPTFTAGADNAVVDRDNIQTSLNGGTSVTITTGTTGTQAGDITVADSITKSAGGNATLTLTAARNITFNAGADVSSTAGQLGLTLNAGGAVTNPATINTNGGLLTYNTVGASTQSGAVSGSGGLTKTGAGTLTLSSANSYTGTTTISAGTLTASGGSAIADTSQVTLANTAGATLNLANSETIGNLSGGGATSGNVALGANTLTVNQAGTTTYNGVLSGTGGLTKAGAGTLTLSRANTYTGATTVSAGTLALGVNNVLSNGSSLVVNGGTFNIANRSDTVAGVQLLSGSISGTTGTLTSTSAYDVQAGTVSARLGGTVGLTKTTSGTVTLSGANTYTGATTINAGTLALGAANRIANASAVTVAAGATFNLAGFAETVGSIAGSGNITLGAGTLTAGGNNTSTAFSGGISGTGGLAKTGAGTLTLSGANTYSGTTAVSAGTLVAASNTALGSTAGGTTVATGATLALQGDIAVGAETLTITGTGVGNNGALRNLSGNNTWGGTVRLAGNAEIQSDAGTLTLAAANAVTNATATARNLTVDGAGNTTISGTITTGSGTLTKTGAGTLTLSGANTYTGATRINAGILVANNATALGTTAGGTTVTAGATLALSGGITVGAEALSLNGNGSNRGALLNQSGNNTWGGTVTLAGDAEIQSDAGTLTLSAANSVTGATRTLTVDGAGNTTINGTITTTTGGLTKNAGGTLTLSGANTYSGATTINGGILVANNATALGSTAGGTTVNASATLALSGGITVGAEALSLNGNGSNRGALLNQSGNNTWGGTVTLAGDAEFQSDAGTLTLSAANSVTGATRTLTVDGPGNTTINGTITTTTGGLTKNGTGTLTLAGANAYTGATNINAGTLALGAANGIADASAVTVASGATFDLNGFGETIGSLAGAGTVTNNGAAAATLTTGSNNTSTAFSGSLQNGTGTLALTKTGTGTFTLSGNNTYGGTTTISGGTLVAASAAALGDTAVGTTVANGALLRVDNVALNAEAVTLQAGGTLSGNGAASLAGNVTQTGAASLAATDSSTLTLNEAVNAGGFATTISGPGSVVATNAANDFSSISISGAQNINVRDANNLTFAASNVSGTLTAAAGGTLTLNGALTAGGTGDAIVLSGSRFVNSAGAGALTAASGRWLVWSSNPNPFGGATPDNRGGLAYDFKQYNATFGVTPVAQATGNGFLYSLAPSITPALAGTVIKVYDGNTTATLTAANLTASGAVDGDTVVLAAAGATYDNRNVGTGKTVTATGITATASNGAAAVYGYTVSPTSASGPVGEITAAPLTVTSIAAVNTSYGTPAATGAVTLSGVIGSDVVTSTASLVSPTYSTSGNLNAGSYAQSASSLGGGDAGNYTLTAFTTPTNNYTVAQLGLTGAAIAASSSTYGSPLNPGAVSFGNVLPGDIVSSAASVNTATLSSSGYPVVGSYTQTAGALAGADAANYSLAGFTTPTANYTIDPLALTGSITASNKVYDGTTAATIASRSLAGAVAGDVVSYIGGTATFADKNAGTAKTVTATGLSLAGADAGNYTVNTAATTTASITPAPLVITADDASRPVNTPNPQFTASYAGFVGGETPAVLNGVLAFSTPATLTSPVGTFPITPYGQSSGNYTITYVDGLLTIQGNPVVTLPVFPREAVSQQAIGARYTDPTMPTYALSGLHYVFDDKAEAREENVPANIVRVIGSGIRLPN